MDLKDCIADTPVLSRTELYNNIDELYNKSTMKRTSITCLSAAALERMTRFFVRRGYRSVGQASRSCSSSSQKELFTRLINAHVVRSGSGAWPVHVARTNIAAPGLAHPVATVTRPSPAAVTCRMSGLRQLVPGRSVTRWVTLKRFCWVISARYSPPLSPVPTTRFQT